jgi:uncharacterized cupredoxin-like copper-binding protein
MRPIPAILTAGLIAAGVSGDAAAQGGAEQRVELSNFDFTPKELHLHGGQQVALVLANLASGGHDFSAPEFFAAARIEPADAALVTRGEVDVPGKETRTIHLVPAAGTYKLTCTHTMHATFGMKGSIVVD